MSKRLWDTTHTFHIADRELIVNPHNFHRITSLRFDGAIINLEGESSTCLTKDLLGRRCPFETIRYFDIEKDYISLPQVMAEDCAKMAWAFLLYLLGAYLFANGGQTLSPRWLAPFRDFKGAREVNWGQACLVYLYSSLDTLRDLA